jgi:hypothetical protein
LLVEVDTSRADKPSGVGVVDVRRDGTVNADHYHR